MFGAKEPPSVTATAHASVCGAALQLYDGQKNAGADKDNITASGSGLREI